MDKPTQEKTTRLESGFDPIWLDSFSDLHTLSKSAFIIRQILRVCRDPKTNICTKSDLSIEVLTGFTRMTIRKARRELVQNGDIEQVGWHTYLIASNWIKNSQSAENKLAKNYPSNWQQNSHQLAKKYPPTGQNLASHITDQNSDIKDSEAKPHFSEEEIPHLRYLYPFQAKKEDLRQHFRNRGFSEPEIGHLLEKVYSDELTGGRV